MVEDTSGVEVVRDRWDELHSQDRFLPKYPNDHVVRWLFTSFPRDRRERAAIKILDLGCGGGRHTVVLAREGFDAYATDISANGLLHTRQILDREGLGATLVLSGMETACFPDASFDGIVAFGVLYYNTLSGLRKTADNIYRLTRPGGQVFVFARTTDDRRYGAGTRIEPNTFLMESDHTSEKDMPIHFMPYDEIKDVFGMFVRVRIEKTETTANALRDRDSDWIIGLEK